MEEIKIIELKIPNLGEAESTEVIEISVKEGDSININDPLIVLESEKAAMEVPSDYEGEIVKITIKEGENVSEGQIFGEIKAFQSFEEEKVIKKEIPKEPEPTEHISNSLDQSEIKFKGINAGPAVEKYARELDIDLTKIDGSGKNSRITKDDLKNFIHGSANKSVNTYADIEDLKSFGNFELVNQSKIKRIGAKNLHKSWISIPRVTHFEEINVTKLEDQRKLLNQNSSIKITPLSYIIILIIDALKEYQSFNFNYCRGRINDKKLY